MASRVAHHEEQQPLLASSSCVVEESSRPGVTSPERSYPRLLLASYVILVLSQFHAGIFNTALKELFEGIICRNFHDGVLDPTTDPRCKTEQTQAELALVFGMEGTFEVIPGLLLSIPYGIAADIYGRRPVAFLSILGCLFYPIADIFIGWRADILSPRWIWAVPITTIIGGGSVIFPTMLYTMISDVAPESKRQGAGAFVILSTAPVLGRLASGPVLYWLMRYGVWHALIFAILAWLPSLLIILMAPETNLLRSMPGITDVGSQSNQKPSSFIATLGQKYHHMSNTAAVSLRQIFWDNPKVCLLLLSGLSLEIGRFLVSGVLPQYMTKRYELEWKEANLWLSIKAALQLTTGLVILPLISRQLSQANIPAVIKDAWIARVSLIFALLGYCLAGLASDLPLFLAANAISAVSIGAEPAMRSLLIATARDSGTGVLFSTMQVILSLGIVVSGPFIAASFRLGLQLGQAWLGLPLLLSSAIMVPTATVLFLMRFPSTTSNTIRPSGA